MREMTKESKMTRGSNAVAAGTSAINGAVIDTEGFEVTEVECCFGTITATAVTGIKWQHGTLSDGSDMADVLGSNLAVPDTASNKMFASELIKPPANNFSPSKGRYVRAVVTRATANAVLDSMVYHQFRGERVMPVTQDTTVGGVKQLISPALGAP